ncbi:uncharacterized protein LOC134528604 [Bacillus rossius redtenbacheri]|uniref:uncharacterized protein LOC134528604 n=1 Tax=Bacillus rossius redtenbacheri TaxID=93214 RepID=UPI002FDD545F
MNDFQEAYEAWASDGYPCPGYNWDYEEQDEGEVDVTAEYTEGPEVDWTPPRLYHMTQHASPLPHTANHHAAVAAKMPPTLRTTETSICHSLPPPTSPPTPPPPYGVETSPQAEEATPFQPLWYNWHARVGWTRQADADPPPPTPPPVAAQVPTET